MWVGNITKIGNGAEKKRNSQIPLEQCAPYRNAQMEGDSLRRERGDFSSCACSGDGIILITLMSASLDFPMIWQWGHLGLRCGFEATSKGLCQ